MVSGTYLVNRDSDLGAVLSLGHLTKGTEHTKASCCLPGACRLSSVVLEKLLCKPVQPIYCQRALGSAGVAWSRVPESHQGGMVRVHQASAGSDLAM